MSVELPPSVELTVLETEPGLKGATVSNVTKPAKTETGLVVQVPAFINEGETNQSQYHRRQLSGTRLSQRFAQVLFFVFEHRSQIQNQAVVFDPADDRRCSQPQLLFKLHRIRAHRSTAAMSAAPAPASIRRR